ncbi:MAG: single-stranded DNA-binding protein [Verrucomicrobiota bacterium]
MASLNKVMLIGNCTRDPEIRYTPKGTAVTELGLAVNRRYTADNGEKREEVTFIDVTLWGKTAEVAAQYLKKGRPLFVEGRLRMDTWDDKTTGQKRSKLGVVGESIEFLNAREGGGAPGGEYDEAPRQSSRPQQQRPPAGRPASAPKAPSDPDLDVEEDDIPF